MQKINDAASLNAAILALENSRRVEWESLKEQFGEIGETVKPLNLIKNAFREAVAPSAGMAAGYIAKKALLAVTRSPLMNILGMMLQMGVVQAIKNRRNKNNFEG